jgi:anthranilate 1,2-dioxygenase small subunit
MNLNALSPVELTFHVERLLARYVHCIDDDRLEEWPEFFVEDCLYRIVSRENVERGLPIAVMHCDSKGMLIDRVTSLRHANVYERQCYRHIVSSVVVDGPSDNGVTARSNYVVYRTRTNGVTKVYSTGVYVDRIVADGDDLRFQEKIVTFDTHRIDSLLALPL